MSALWVVQLTRGEADVVDAGWAFGIGLVVIFYAVFAGSGYAPRQFLIALLVSIWSLRLTYYLLRYRVLKAGEDGRYVTLREKWGVDAQRNFFVFFQAQGMLVVVLSLPFLLIIKNPAQGFALYEMLGVMLWAAAFIGEVIADRQLNNFRLTPENHGKTCMVGLWRYSRHPNYFFEWLMWLAYGIIALSAPFGVLGFLSAAIMLILILKVTGIPPTEQRAMASRPQEYAEYQRTTSAFVPWWPKGVKAEE